MADRREFGYIRKLPSGRYQAIYMGPDLARHKAPSTFEKRDLAVVWLRNEQRMIEDAIADEAALGLAGGAARGVAPQVRTQGEVRGVRREVDR